MSSEARATLDAAMTEAQLQTTVEECLTQFGWRWMHISDRLYKLAAKEGRHDALRGAKGFPDICAMRGGVCLFIELKTMNGSLDPEQVEWREEVKAVQEMTEEVLVTAENPNPPPDFDVIEPVQYHLWRPRHLSDGTIERTLR